MPPREHFDLARAGWAFPLVGATLGALVAALGWSTHLLVPVLVAATLAVLVDVLATGALHLDGLADCADGCGGHDRQSRLRIMKDHSVGVYGAAAIVLAVLLHVTVLAGLLTAGISGWTFLVVVAAAGALSRAAMLPLARWLRYARTDGTAGALVEGLRTGPVVAASLIAVAATGGTLLLAGPGAALAQLMAGTVVPLLVGVWAYRTLGGVTGDVLGAGAELTRSACLLAPLALLGS